jgi:hypothetical protein
VSEVDARRATVVAFHGPKPPALTDLVERMQAFAADRLGTAFRPRPLADVHATVIGLENGPPRLDPAPLAGEIVEALDRERPRLQLGGFGPGFDGFRSRGLRPYERTVVLQGEPLVLMGWTTSAGSGRADPVAVVGDLRHRCERFGVRHKHHVDGAPQDDDLWLVIGVVDATVGEQERSELASTARDRLAGWRTDVELTADDVALVEYESTELPAATSRRCGLRAVARSR